MYRTASRELVFTSKSFVRPVCAMSWPSPARNSASFRMAPRRRRARPALVRRPLLAAGPEALFAEDAAHRDQVAREVVHRVHHAQRVFEVVEGVAVLVVVEDALPDHVGEEALVHAELFEEALREKELQHDHVRLFARVEEEVVVPVPVQVAEVWSAHR